MQVLRAERFSPVAGPEEGLAVFTTISAPVISMRELDQRATQAATAPIREPATPAIANPERLLKQCHEMAQDRLSKSLTSMLDKVEETLWGMAEAAPDRDTRDLYIQAKDKAKAQRSAIEAQFKKRFESEFEQRAGKGASKAPEESKGEFDLSTLSLVDDESLSESLKVKDLASKMRGMCDEELRALDQRIGVLLKNPDLKDENNPLSPDSIFSAFKQACDEIEAGLKIKMIILNLFDQQVHKEIQGIYKDINSLLVQNSVLPKIRFGLGRPIVGGGSAAAIAAMASAQGAAIAAPQGMPQGAEGMPGGFAVPGADAGAIGNEQDLFGMLQGLLARQYGGGAMSGAAASMTTLTGMPAGFGAGSHLGTATGPVQLMSGADLLGALTHLQQGDASLIQGAPNALAAAIKAPSGVNILRDLQSTSFGKGMGEVDNMTLDIVAMLFDHILDDKKIPDAMKALIGRLQIPILKVAILDKTFFQKKHHPARRMLNTLGEFGLGLGLDFQTTNPLFRQVEAILQKLIDAFEDDLTLFDKAEADLELVIETENRRAEEEAARTARLLELREKLEVARATAQKEVKSRAQAGQMPQAVLKFLAEEWIKLLVMAHAKAGADSGAWKSAMETMDDLIWSVSVKGGSEDRRKLTALLPVLLRRLQKGMQIIGTTEEVRTKFLSKLMRCHTKIISGGHEAPRKPAKPVARVAPAPIVAPPLPTAPPAAPEIPTLSDVVETPHIGVADSPTMEFNPTTLMSEAERAAVAEPTPVVTAQAPEPLPEIHASPEYEEVTPAAAPQEAEDDTDLAQTLPPFKSMVIKNPFGDGEIEVEEISLDSIPAFSNNPSAKGDSLASLTGDEYSLKAGGMTVGTWIELGSSGDTKVQARLSWISPLKGTYLFTNRHGAKVAEYSLYQLAKEMRTGACTIMEEVPLFDRAMSSLVGVLRKEEES